MNDTSAYAGSLSLVDANEITAPLPAEPVNYTYPLGICGVDYAGPLMANVRY